MTSIIKVDTIQSAAGSTVLEQTNATTITLGTSGQTIVPASNVTLSGIATTNGITEADQWRLTTNFSNDAQPIASNLERNDTSFSYIGTGMSESSGVFTFPSTGIYLVKYNITAIISGNGEDGKVNPLIEITTDGTNFSTVADSQFNLADDSNGTLARGSTELNIIFDVTNTSTHKVRFTVLVNNTSTQTNSSSTENRTYFTFIRLGDT